jgi:hypothetical protein
VHVKKNIMSCMTTTTHTMVVELSHEVVVSFMRWLFHNNLFLSLLTLSPPHHQKYYVALHETIYSTADVYTLRPKIFAPFDFYRLHLTIRLIQNICENIKIIMIYLKYI